MVGKYQRQGPTATHDEAAQGGCWRGAWQLINPSLQATYALFPSLSQTFPRPWHQPYCCRQNDDLYAIALQKEVFQDLGNFGLCTRTRHRFGR